MNLPIHKALMDQIPEQLEIPLTLRVPRSAFTIVAPEPVTVTQQTAERHFGIPPRAYKQMFRDGLFPAKRIGRLIFAAYEDVKRAVTEGAVARAKLQRPVRRSAEAKPVPMSVDAAENYVASARTPRELRERKKEVQAEAWKLINAYDAKLNDGSPNPKYDKALYDHGMSLVLAGAGLRRPDSTNRAAPARRDYGTCCWCERPAYATKQTWNEDTWSWCGGPVCERCARNRADNERVVQLETQTILFRAKNANVPAEWRAPRRPRKRTPRQC